jgi:ribulose bisphosphate carboxylase small subunit
VPPKRKKMKKIFSQAPVILATQEAEIRIVADQPWQIVFEILSQRKPITEKGWWSGSRCRPCQYQQKLKLKLKNTTKPPRNFLNLSSPTAFLQM